MTILSLSLIQVLSTKYWITALESKKISKDQELIKSDPISCPQTKREITKYINWQQSTKGTRGKPNKQLFPRQVVIQLPKFN